MRQMSHGALCLIQAFKESKEVSIIAIVIVNAVIGYLPRNTGAVKLILGLGALCNNAFLKKALLMSS